MARSLDVLRFRVRSLLRRSRADAELDRELREHLERQVEEYVARGMAPDDARRAALATFGGVQNVREEARDARGVAAIESLLRDFRYTLRALLHEPMLLVAAALSIALGVGGNIAVFSLARAVVFAPPDAREPATLVNARVSHGSHVSYQRWRDIDAGGALEHFAGYSIEGEVNWLDAGGAGGAAVSIVPMLVTANFFEVTGTPVARGRAFSAAEARMELDPHVAVISHEFWQLRLGGDSGIIGRKLVINGEPYTVMGVLPSHLRSVAGFGIAPAVYLPLNRSLGPDSRAPKATIVQLVGRLKPGQGLAEGRAALDALDRRLARLDGDTLYGGVQDFASVNTFRTGKEARTIGLFLAVLGVVSLSVLLIACANVAGLLIARGTRRRQEIAVRLAIGGSRARLVQQLMIEGLWLALIGTAAGIGLSVAFMRVVNSLSLPIPFPIALNLTTDRAVFACALGLVALTVLTCALLPALRATRISLVPALKREEPFYIVRRFTARGVLLTGQVMVSTILLVTAILFVRNLVRTQVTSPGFEVNHALVAQIGFVQGRRDADHATFLQAAADRVRSLPGVAGVAYAASMPLTVHTGSSNGLTARIDGSAQTQHVEFSREIVGPEYFSTMGIRVLGGREFVETDAAGTPPVAIVNEVFARRYLGGKNPLGQRVQFKEDSSDFRVVGVVANSKMRTLGEDERAAIYVPLKQSKKSLRVGFVITRTQNDPTALVGPVRQALGALDKSVAVSVEPMASALQFALLPSRIGASVLGTLGLLGLALAAFGLYALVSYSVSRRVGEIAIRSALGASRGAILRLVMRDATLHVGVGLALGLAVSALITSPLSAFLVAGLSTTDPLSFGGTALVFILVSLLASWLPARFAMRVSPVVAMRLD
ncbi:MAG TPA: ADOP family duplicated permease [Gemmatimonadaceae bacterium]|nr:ADOP family duplicated permease [Gemmatimonadaceae bacterium]